MACIQKERKPMMPLKTLDVIFRRRNVPNSQYYFTNRKHSLAKSPAKKAKPFQKVASEKLLSYIKYSDRKDKVMARHRLSLPLHLKDNFKIAASRDISQRLYIEEPPDDVKAVVEIHPEFYTVIEGRPLRIFDDIKVYLSNIRAFAMNRQQIGFRRDIILRIERNMIDEINEYDRINRNYKHHVKDFQVFLTEDYKKACIKVSKAEKAQGDLQAKNIEFLSYVTKVTILNNIVFKLDAIRSVLKIYRSYLIFVAPISWRQHYDETLRGRVQSIQFETGEFVTDNDLAELPDIDRLLEMAKIEFQTPLPAPLYFTSPQQMVYLFRNMELQSREYLNQLSKTDAPYRMLHDRMKQLKKATTQELEYFHYYIDCINDQIAREHFNEKHLQEKFFGILNGCFYESVASPDTLKIKICIEYVYEQIYGKCEEGHQCIMDPMKILEVLYEDYNLRLDGLDFKTVNAARKELFEEDLIMMNNAYKAQRILKEFREMTNAINKAFYPPAQFKRPEIKTFVKKKTAHPGVPKARRRRKPKMTEEMKEDLLFFTEWCENKDPKPYIKQYNEFVKPAFKLERRKSTVYE